MKVKITTTKCMYGTFHEQTPYEAKSDEEVNSNCWSGAEQYYCDVICIDGSEHLLRRSCSSFQLEIPTWMTVPLHISHVKVVFFFFVPITMELSIINQREWTHLCGFSGHLMWLTHAADDDVMLQMHWLNGSFHLSYLNLSWGCYFNGRTESIHWHGQNWEWES